MQLNKLNIHSLIATGLATAVFSAPVAAASLSEALDNGKAYGDLRLRYESVQQDNAAEDASALTLRTRLGYKTGDMNGFSAAVEFEDSRVVLGQSDFTVGPTGFNSGQYSVIADPETTEVDQAFLQYKSDQVTAKFGRQVLTMDNHRFVGHVGWRQDRQTFDGLSVNYAPSKSVNVSLAYLEKRNRIFAEAADIDAEDLLLNAGFKLGNGKLSSYAYLLNDDDGVDDAIDTYGLRYAGKAKVGDTALGYTVEYATQSSEAGDNDADYYFVELAATSGKLTTKFGYEVLGSDDGAYGFSTPLATLHKFNGWADLYLATPQQGLVDVYISLAGKIAGGKWALTYHDFSADEASAAVDDLGSEINALYARQFGHGVSGGIKYAAFNAGDIKVDTDKLWVWMGYRF